jgi:hypothetical protein
MPSMPFESGNDNAAIGFTVVKQSAESTIRLGFGDQGTRRKLEKVTRRLLD